MSSCAPSSSPTTIPKEPRSRGRPTWPKGLNAALIVTNVAPGDHDSAGRDPAVDRLDQARAYLAERGLELASSRSVSQPAEAIVGLADERNADLIVVGMRKKGFFERLVEEASRRTSCGVRRATSSPFTDPLNDPRLILAGLITGLLVGMTGMGGGSLMTPLLIFLFNFNPATAIGTDILHGAIFKSFGAVRHRRLGTVRARLAGWMLLERSFVPARGLDRDLPDRPLRRQRRLRAGPGARLHAPVRGARVRRQGARASEQARRRALGRLTTAHRRGLNRPRRRLHRRADVGEAGRSSRSRCSSPSRSPRSSSSARASPMRRRCSGSPGSATSSPATSTSPRSRGSWSARSRASSSGARSASGSRRPSSFSLAAVLALSDLKLLDVPYMAKLVIVSLAGLAALAVWGEGLIVPAHAAGAKKSPPEGPAPDRAQRVGRDASVRPAPALLAGDEAGREQRLQVVADRPLRETEGSTRWQTQASPSGWAWMRLRRRRRAGSASTLSTRAARRPRPARAPAASGGQLAATVATVLMW